MHKYFSFSRRILNGKKEFVLKLYTSTPVLELWLASTKDCMCFFKKIRFGIIRFFAKDERVPSLIFLKASILWRLYRRQIWYLDIVCMNSNML